MDVVTYITPINIVIAGLWLASAVVDYSDFTYLWQLKEYRIDRMRDFFSTRQGKMYFLRYQLLWRSLIVIVLSFWPINEVIMLKEILLALFVIDALYCTYRFAYGKLRHPHPTKKILGIFLLTISIEAGLFLLLRDWNIPFILMVLRFATVSFVVECLTVPTKLLKAHYIKKAGEKIASYPNLVVIGVTGSYGKSSVKEFLAHILSKKYTVIRTPRNINTEIGVAQFILKSNFADKQVFIVEMGAYRIGDIAQICSMVRPQVGILTAINEQHLSLFGTIQNTQEAKYELLRSISPSGLSVANSDNDYCREYLHTLVSPVATFGYDEQYHPQCQITHVHHQTTGVACSFLLSEKQTINIETPLIGEYHCANIAPCVLVARHLGMSLPDIADQCKTLPQTGVRRYTYGNCIIIDDSYNSNPDGFKSAIDVLSSFPSSRRRIVITRGMLELGDKSDDLHERIGEEIAFAVDELVLLTKDFEAPLRRGINEKYRTTIVVKDEPKELLEYVRSLRNTDAVILLENRIPAIVHEEVMKHA